jgi:hypothetical protein
MISGELRLFQRTPHGLFDHWEIEGRDLPRGLSVPLLCFKQGRALSLDVRER